jgi:ribosomal protein S18 acetylase RimI-like enzyme
MAPTPIEIVALDREGLDRHLEALAGILRACVHDGASVSFILPFELDQAREFWLGKVAPGVIANKRVLLIAKLDGEVAGTVQLDLDTPPNQQHRAEVAKLLVHPSYRKLGVGRALMQRILSCCVDAGRSLVTLDTAGDAAEALYASLGFERAGRIPFYAKDPIADRLDATTFMYKVLR